MNLKRILIFSWLVLGFLCAPVLAADANEAPAAAAESAVEQPQIQAAETNEPPVAYVAYNAQPATETIGSIDPNSGYEFKLELDTQGAAIRRATFSGFDDRDYQNPQPLDILSPVRINGNEFLSMANRSLIFVDRGQQLPLGQLYWRSLGATTSEDGSQTAAFETTVEELGTGIKVLKLTKSYRILKDNYSLQCDLTLENLSDAEQKVRFAMAGPLGIGREDIRGDARKVVAGFKNTEGQITSARLDKSKLLKAKDAEERRLAKNSDNFLWAAVVNKYFAAIVVPLAEEGKQFADWLPERSGRLFNPDGDAKADSGDETIGLDFQIAARTLAPAGQQGSSRTYSFEIYLGPKDQRLFDDNERYLALGFQHTIDFMGCCCPQAMINPLAFGILATMEWMYQFIPNYGWVIIILVLLIRLVIHPLTKKSQVSMSKFSKLGPRLEELKKKYADNKVELQRQTMALYREQGASPVMGMLPMFVQMPIWIALYSAINASIALRGEPFILWIKDLSAPDALFRFPALTIPIFGWTLDSFNLLPILMGVAFYLQQKLMPSQAAASTNPQVAQQQKMMMIMMPILFPVMLYPAPSGLNLYIMASTFGGVFEQYVIRKHIREKEEAEAQGLVPVTSKTGGKVKKKKPKPFFKNR